MDLLHNFKFNFGRTFLEPILTLSNLFMQNYQRTVMCISGNYRIHDLIFVNIAQAVIVFHNKLNMLCSNFKKIQSVFEFLTCVDIKVGIWFRF